MVLTGIASRSACPRRWKRMRPAQEPAAIAPQGAALTCAGFVRKPPLYLLGQLTPPLAVLIGSGSVHLIYQTKFTTQVLNSEVP
jgi:hypothetical protein